MPHSAGRVVCMQSCRHATAGRHRHAQQLTEGDAVDDQITEKATPVAERTFWATIYALMAIAGVWVLLDPPTTIETPLGDGTTVLWGSLWATGAVTAIAAGAGRYKWEYVLIWFIMGGVGVYAVTLWTLVLYDSTGRGPQALLVSALLIVFIRRWFSRRLILQQQENRQQ